jgi:2-oxoisovalerate dehydrogenase E2 component (dihydrolipoyl transacylase)
VTTSEFLLPDAGEGLTEAEIVSWKVAPGDTVAVNQVIVEIETAKSLVELPSPFDGVVEEILVAEGVTVAVGTPIISVATGAGAPEQPPPRESVEETDTVTDTAASVSSEDKPGAVLVGYGLKGAVSSRRGAGRRADAESRPTAPRASGSVLAKPPIRKLAKDLEVDLASVIATGPVGEVTRDDVLRQASQVSVFRNLQTPEWAPEREERIPVKGVRKAIASAMVSSAFSAPHVGVFVDVDATRTMEFVKRLKSSTDFAGVKVSPLLIIAKAIIWAVRRNPTVNAQWTDEEIIVKHFVNLGIAAATPRGLIVPNIKDAHDLSLLELAQAIEQLTTTARDGKTQPAEMSNGTITITNIGVFGMDTGTPILNPGEVAIVALGTIKQKPWVVDGEVRARYVTTLGASFDHRVVDGDVASRFLADVASIVEEPALLLD